MRLAGRAGRREVRRSPPPAQIGSLSKDEAITIGVLAFGAHSYGHPDGSPRVVVYHGDTATVEIGKYCSIAGGVQFVVGGNHRPDWVTTFPLRIVLDLPGARMDGMPTTKGDIVVGNDVWIGADAKILSGVTIGDGAVIGASAVVASDIRPYAIVVGNPAREIRRRFSDTAIDALQRIAWWDWPDDVVPDRVRYLCDFDIDEFIDRFG